MTNQADPYQVMRTLAPEELAGLRESIRLHGVLVPVVEDQHGNVIDGHHRRDVCIELGIEQPTIVHPVRDPAHARLLAHMFNSVRRMESKEDRDRQIIVLACEVDGNGIGTYTQADIAVACGCARSVVSAAIKAYGQDHRFVASDEPMILPTKRMDATGTPRSATNVKPIPTPDPEEIEEEEIEDDPFYAGSDEDEYDDDDDDDDDDEWADELVPAARGWHQLGEHRLYCGDSTDAESIAARQGAFAFADPQ